MGAADTTSGGRPRDTSPEAWTLLQQRLAGRSPAEKAHLANAMSIDCERLARAGIALNEPAASDARIRYLLAVRRYGKQFADHSLGPTEC